VFGAPFSFAHRRSFSGVGDDVTHAAPVTLQKNRETIKVHFSPGCPFFR